MAELERRETPGAKRANQSPQICCSSAGQRYVEVTKIDAHTADILNAIRFADEAKLFVGEYDIDNIKGIKAKSDEWALSVSKINQTWRFAFDDHKGNVGNLTFALPEHVTKFEVDPRDRSGRLAEPMASAHSSSDTFRKSYR